MNLTLRHSKLFTQTRNAIEKQHKKIVVHEGSARSTKTYSVIQYLIDTALRNTGLKYTLARAKLTWLKATLLPDFVDILTNQFHVYDPDDFHRTDMVYHLNGNEFGFIGLDEPQKVHGRKQDYFWINEGIEARHKDFEQLIIRTTRAALIDYNPSCTSHWIFDKVIPRDDCAFIHSTYKDNPFLEQTIIDEIERLKGVDQVSWKIYGLGLRAAHAGLIFPKIKIVDEFPADAKSVGYGLDFGFTNDPSALIKGGILHGEIYLDEIFYKRGLTNTINPDMPSQPTIEAGFIKGGVTKAQRIFADSAEPKSIKEIRNKGWSIKGAEKGADSVRHGIETMKKYKINVTARSVNLLKEGQNYKWKTDPKDESRMGKEPVDAWNHGWDAARYWAWMTLNKSLPALVIV